MTRKNRKNEKNTQGVMTDEELSSVCGAATLELRPYLSGYFDGLAAGTTNPYAQAFFEGASRGVLL